MNVAPNISLNTVERIAPAYADALLGVILTLKLNDWKFTDEIPKLLRRVEKLDMVKIRARPAREQQAGNLRGGAESQGRGQAENAGTSKVNSSHK